jgi:hypothetical protein
MTVGVSTGNVANKWLEAIRGGTTITTLSGGVFVKLHTADPGAAGATAAAAGSTTRPLIQWTAAAAGAIAMTGTAPSWTNGGTSETLSHLSFWDANTAGNFLGSCALGSTQAWNTGNVFTLTSQGWSITPLAA